MVNQVRLNLLKDRVLLQAKYLYDVHFLVKLPFKISPKFFYKSESTDIFEIDKKNLQLNYLSIHQRTIYYLLMCR